MIFYKSTLSAYFLAQALFQISVSADEPRTKVQPYDGPAVTHSVNGAVTICDKNGCVTTLNKDIIEDHSVNVYPEKKEVVFTIVKCKSDIYPECKNGDQRCINEQTAYEECVDGKWTYKPCRPNVKCYTLNGPRVTCALGNNEAECSNGETRCASDTAYSEICSNGKWTGRKCGDNQKCRYTDINTYGCADINVPECKNGASRCNPQRFGAEYCPNGKWEFRKCGGNEECKITEGNFAKCVDPNPPAPACNNGDQKCNSEQTAYEECVDKKWTYKACKLNEKCYTLNGFKVTCGLGNNEAECSGDATRCASDGVDSETCSNGKWVRRKCSANQTCRYTDINTYGCADINVPECKNGASRCNPQRFGAEYCPNGKWEFRKCGGNEECKITEGNFAKCVDPNPPAPACNNGDQKCNSEQTAYEECVDGKWTYKACKLNEKCYTLNGFKVTCGLGNNEAECSGDATRCASDGVDSETCSNGKWVRRKCSANQTCRYTDINTYGCADINVPECKNGASRCNPQRFGAEYCPNGKWEFRKCGGNEECKITEGNFAKCVDPNPPAPACNNGDQKCNSEQTAYEECVDGKWTYKACKLNEKCYTLNGFKVTCGLGNNEAECKD
ncbi:hypothetical protein BB561_002205, partial [Smittium simulii]